MTISNVERLLHVENQSYRNSMKRASLRCHNLKCFKADPLITFTEFQFREPQCLLFPFFLESIDVKWKDNEKASLKILLFVLQNPLYHQRLIKRIKEIAIDSSDIRFIYYVAIDSIKRPIYRWNRLKITHSKRHTSNVTTINKTCCNAI